MPGGPCEYLRAIDRSAVELGKASKKTGFCYIFFLGWRRRSGVSQEEEEQKPFDEDQVGSVGLRVTKEQLMVESSGEGRTDVHTHTHARARTHTSLD